MKQSKKLTIVIIVLLIIIFIMGGTLIYLITNIKDNKPKPKTKIQNNTKLEEKKAKEDEERFKIPDGATIGSINTTDNINYSLDISQYNANDIVYYRLNSDYVVSLNFYDISNYNVYDNFKNFSISVNGVSLDIDSITFGRKGSLSTDAKTINMSLLGDYLIFNNMFWTDIRSSSIYIISLKNNISKKIGEMESIQGMIPKGGQLVTKDGLTISGSREDHGAGIVYNGNSIYVCDDGVNNIPADTIFSATYFYKYDGKTLDLENPQKTNIVTVGEYSNNSENTKYCNR